MAITIEVENLQRRIPINPRQIIKAVKRFLRHEGISRAKVSIVFVADPKIRSLNKKYLKHDHPTDVLSFDYGVSSPPAILFNRRAGPPSKNSEILGEIIISTDTVKRNAAFYRTREGYELMLYVLHGILHLLGFDDRSPSAKRKMRRKEGELLKFLRI